MNNLITPLKHLEFSQETKARLHCQGADSIGSNLSKSNDKLLRPHNSQAKNGSLLLTQSLSPEMAKVIRHIQPNPRADGAPMKASVNDDFKSLTN